jgi:SAM-dependent methyltransferase
MVHLRNFTTIIPQPVRFGLRRVFHKGRGVTCVLCGTEVRGFRPHGGGANVLDARQVAGGMRREDDRCPVCHACDRTRMIMLWLEAEAGVGSGVGGTRPCRILHVAPDFGLYLWLKRQTGVEYTGSDIDAARYRHIDNIRAADLTGTPFPDDAFDIVICSHVLEHVPDDRAALREILRILAPGGRALLLTPFALDGAGTDEDPSLADPAERHRRFGQWDHVRLYDREDFVTRMAEAGFETALFEPFVQHPEAAERLHLNPLEALPVGTKPLAGPATGA